MAFPITLTGKSYGGTLDDLVEMRILIEEVSRNVVTNKSTYRFTFSVASDEYLYDYEDPWMELTVNGIDIFARFTTVDLSEAYSQVLAVKEQEFSHNADGTLTLNVSGSMDFVDNYKLTGIYLTETAVSVEPLAPLSVIYTQSSLVANPIPIDRDPTKTRVGANCVSHKLEIYYQGVLIGSRANFDMASTSIPLTSEEITDLYSRTSGLTNFILDYKLYSYSQANNVGLLGYTTDYSTKKYPVAGGPEPLPTDTVPILSDIILTDLTKLPTSGANLSTKLPAGYFLQHLSRVKMEIGAVTLFNNATITQYELIWSKDNSTHNLSSIEAGSLTATTYTVKGRIKDSQGLWSNQITKNVVFNPYSKPKLTYYDAVRVDEFGNETQNGTRVKHKIGFEAPSIKLGSPATERNPLKFFIAIRKNYITKTIAQQNLTERRTGDPLELIVSTTITTNGESGEGHSASEAHEFSLVLMDNFEETTSLMDSVPIGQTAFSWGTHGMGAGGIFDNTDPSVMQIFGDLNIKGTESVLKRNGVDLFAGGVVPIDKTGWQKFPSGAIIQWGTFDFPPITNYVQLVFPVEFVSTAYVFVGTYRKEVAEQIWSNWIVTNKNLSKSGTEVSVVAGDDNGNSIYSGTVQWIAIGV